MLVALFSLVAVVVACNPETSGHTGATEIPHDTLWPALAVLPSSADSTLGEPAPGKVPERRCSSRTDYFPLRNSNFSINKAAEIRRCWRAYMLGRHCVRRCNTLGYIDHLEPRRRAPPCVYVMMATCGWQR